MIRKNLHAALALAGALVTFAPSPVTHAQTIELKVSHYLPPNHTVQKTLEAWGEDIDKRSGGLLKLKIYPAAQLGPVQRQFDLVRNGQADLAVGLTGATLGRYPLTELASLPFVWPKAGSTSEVMSKRWTALAPEYLAKEYEGLQVLWLGVAPTVSFFTSRKEIKSLADVRGLKLRFQGEQHAKIIRELGGVPLQVPPGEIADGISKGVIDGAIFNYEAAEAFGLGSVTKFVSEPGFMTATLALALNADKYKSLPDDLKKIVDETTGPIAAVELGKRWDAAEQHGREYMVGQKVSIVTLAPDQIQKMRTTLEPVLKASIDAWEKQGKPAQALVDEYLK